MARFLGEGGAHSFGTKITTTSRRPAGTGGRHRKSCMISWILFITAYDSFAPPLPSRWISRNSRDKENGPNDVVGKVDKVVVARWSAAIGFD